MHKFYSDRSDNDDHADQNGWNHGLGKVVRKAVQDPEATAYDSLDSLPKHENNHKRLGYWGHRRPNIHWRKVNRWVLAQVGRHIDDVRSEFIKLANEGDPYIRERLVSAFESNVPTIRGQIEICISKEGGWPYLGLVTETGHIEKSYYRRRDLYINLSGIICQVSNKTYKELERLQEKQRKESNNKVIWVNDVRGFICLRDQWFEVIYAKLNSDFNRNLLSLDCLLCRKLKKSWYNSHLEVFGHLHGNIYCVALRSVSYRDIEKLLV